MAHSETPPESGSLDTLRTTMLRALRYLARCSPQMAASTQIPARQWAQSCRALVNGGRAGEVLLGLTRTLERLEAASPAERPVLARRCLHLLEGLGSETNAAVATAPRSLPAGGARYRRSSAEPAAGLEQLQRSVQFAHGVGSGRAELLRKFGIATIEDLLYHLPFRYEDRRRLKKISELRAGEEASVAGEITNITERTVGRAQRRILEAVLRDETGLLGLTWYHRVAYFRNRYRSGQRCLVHGKVEWSGAGGKRIVHPEIDTSSEDAPQGILPVYEKPATISVSIMRKIVQQAVADFAGVVPSTLPEPVARAARVTDLASALRAVHVPAPDAPYEELQRFSSLGHRSLVFDELFFLQLGMTLRRRATAREAGIALGRRADLCERLIAALPFSLTGAQRRVVEEIWADMAQPHPMHRLVQGDVGSGKTVVALLAALVAIENEHQAALMAPTELLAEQHFASLSRLTEPLGLSMALLTGACSRAERKRIYAALADGSVQLAVGTHALIQEDVRFHRLGLGVIDEQHRFGVLQRAALRRLGESSETRTPPDILIMTATPIPRTLALTVYGDLDVSILDELPPGRKPVRTLVMNESERQRVYQLVRRELEAAHQAYVVYPLVESSEKEDLRDATTMANELARTVFPGHRVGLVHGRMKSEEKDAVMRRFRDGDLQLLVSTTVIEVGVDVPNATIMVVEHAERFGLSQLHQLRGRVGRGGEQATCILVAPYRKADDTYRRLKAMADSNDGFKIAEIDLELRGPGEFLGTRQSGLPDFRVANLLRDSRLLTEAQKLATSFLDGDPTLEKPESASLRAVLRHRWAGRLGLAEIG